MRTNHPCYTDLGGTDSSPMMSYKASIGHVVDRGFYHAEMLRTRRQGTQEVESGCEVMDAITEACLFKLP